MVHNLKSHSRDQSPTLRILKILKRGKGTKPRTLRIIPSPKMCLLKKWTSDAAPSDGAAALWVALQPYFQVREPISEPWIALLRPKWRCCANYRAETFWFIFFAISLETKPSKPIQNLTKHPIQPLNFIYIIPSSKPNQSYTKTPIDSNYPHQNYKLKTIK